MEPYETGTEITLEKYCSRLPVFHRVRRELRVLRHCREHPLRWAIYDMLRKLGLRVRAPIAKGRGE